MDAAFGGSTGGISGASFGKGGSMARFGLYDNFFYTVGQYQLFVFNVSEASNPVKIATQSIGWNVETMFLYDRHMFLGTTKLKRYQTVGKYPGEEARLSHPVLQIGHQQV